MDDVDYLGKFVDNILLQFPAIEDGIDRYPEGYVTNVYFE